MVCGPLTQTMLVITHLPVPQVVDQIQKSCGDITEEELAKLSVALLNCQSESEGRPLFECSEHMVCGASGLGRDFCTHVTEVQRVCHHACNLTSGTPCLQSIAECTSAMDPHVWNAYHIISNRARSVCYATRQQLFRHRTEVAVNRLALSTQDQLASMAVLREGQVEVHEATKAALTSVQEGQVELAGQQGRLRAAHAQLQASVSVNLGELGREKSMIAQSQEQLMNMTESVLSKLGQQHTLHHAHTDSPLHHTHTDSPLHHTHADSPLHHTHADSPTPPRTRRLPHSTKTQLKCRLV